ncbi:MAG: hypothetical protein V4558_02660 [Gemmatimonadota bacterium]
MNRRRRLLLVSYHFPPVGGAGVQRPVKFARYLPEFGWDVSVLQAANPSVPLLDPTLLDELSADTVIEKARTFEPSYAAKQAVNMREGANTAATPRPSRLRRLLKSAATVTLQPDAQILWLPDAVRHGRQLLRRLPHDAILATAPTYTNLLVGALLAKHSGLPLICDYRDEWDISSTYWENAPKARLAHAVQGRMQRFVLRRSAAIVATTKASTARVAMRAGEAGVTLVARCIYNGWDAGDLAEAAHVAPALPRMPGTFRLVYAGTLWNLTSIAPVAAAVELLARESPALVSRLELVAVGRKTPDQLAQLQRVAAAGATVENLDYAPHPVALATMTSADAVLLLLSDVPGAERVAPAKVFEYLAVRRPILAVLPEGEIAELVRESDADSHRLPSDVTGIASWLRHRLAGKVNAAPAGNDAQIARFERRALSGELAGLLDELMAERAT